MRPDPRFLYRVQDVPAASHPTVAAALARFAGAQAHDVVWDPFVGSGLELIERARLGPYARLIGSDLDARALAASRANFEAAAVADVDLATGGCPLPAATERAARLGGLAVKLGPSVDMGGFEAQVQELTRPR